MKTDSFSINKYVSNTIYGKTPVGWLAIVTLFSWLTNAFFISILNKSLKTEDIYYLKKKRLPLILLAIPGTVAVIMAMVIKFVPYLGGGVELKELPICIAAIMLINMLYVAGMISLTAALHHNKKLRSSQEL